MPDSFAITGNDGRFQTLYFVPDEQAEGDMDITVSFDGSGATRRRAPP
ncbi:hypothetical protein G7085_13920 [Tessaracoccus sp. HDW20]|nr:hypothetical protein [Tessaracoccus coleopterorum]NHB85346.1 hypothetical protein [Tessaracoccus coleopterorum]